MTKTEKKQMVEALVDESVKAHEEALKSASGKKREEWIKSLLERKRVVEKRLAAYEAVLAEKPWSLWERKARKEALEELKRIEKSLELLRYKA